MTTYEGAVILVMTLQLIIACVTLLSKDNKR